MHHALSLLCPWNFGEGLPCFSGRDFFGHELIVPAVHGLSCNSSRRTRRGRNFCRRAFVPYGATCPPLRNTQPGASVQVETVMLNLEKLWHTGVVPSDWDRAAFGGSDDVVSFFESSGRHRQHHIRCLRKSLGSQAARTFVNRRRGHGDPQHSERDVDREFSHRWLFTSYQGHRFSHEGRRHLSTNSQP